MIKKHIRRGFLLCLGVTSLVLGMTLFGWLDNLELRAVDYRFKIRGERPINNDLVLVNIDEKSIEEMGRWTWPRKTHGELIAKMKQAGARVVSFDTLFTESDLGNLESDEYLAAASFAADNVVSAMLFKRGIDEIYGKGTFLPY